MKLAYFSPMPPARTGIATYSRHLVRALAAQADVTVWSENGDAEPLEGVEIVPFTREPCALKSLHEYDRVLYHVGNNPYFHLEIRRAASLFPGTVCLHDIVVYYLAAGFGRGGLLKELLLADPGTAVRELARIESECPEGNLLRYATPSRNPAMLGLLRDTPHIIVHNETSARTLRETGYRGRVDVIPLLHYADEHAAASADETARVRAELGYGPDDVVFGAFGFIGATKRLDKVFDAMAAIGPRVEGRNVRLLVVGEGDPIEGMVRANGLQDAVRHTGFVADADFARYLAAIDVFVNLRYPSHGESSASLIQAMSLAKACLVTNDAFFAELPDEAVAKIPHDEHEVPMLVERMRALAADPRHAARVGEAARNYVLRVHAPAAIASRFLESLAAAPRMRPRPAAETEFDPQTYLRYRVKELCPG